MEVCSGLPCVKSAVVRQLRVMSHELHGMSNPQQLNWLFKKWFKFVTKKTSKLLIIGSQRARNMKNVSMSWCYIDGLVQERHKSIANALELYLSCTNPSIWLLSSSEATLQNMGKWVTLIHRKLKYNQNKQITNIYILYEIYFCITQTIMTSSNGNIFRITGPLWGEFTGHWWIPPHKGQWRGALMFPLICAWINGWVNNPEAGNLRHHCAHYDAIVMCWLGVSMSEYWTSSASIAEIRCIVMHIALQ